MDFYLPEDLLECILKRLMKHIDVLRFGQVCRSWRRIAVENRRRLPPSLALSYCLPPPDPLPLLLLPPREEHVHRVYSLSDQKVVGSLSLPETDKKWVCGSSIGWLLMVDVLDPEDVLLFNPITRVEISLPPLSTFTFPQDTGDPDAPRNITFIRKFLLSSEPGSESADCVVMVVVGNRRRLAFCRLGDDRWIEAEDCPIGIEDLICYKGQLYFTIQRGTVYACKMYPTNVSRLDVRKVAGPIFTQILADKRYLVELSGELLHVERYSNECYEDGMFKTINFSVFKLDEGSSKWVEMKGLGDNALFLGSSCSMSISAKDHPSCVRNCIHFTDNIYLVEFDFYAARDNGTFYLEDGRIEYLDSGGQVFTRPPMWMVPKPW